MSEDVICRQFHHAVRKHFEYLFDAYPFELVHCEDEEDVPFCLLVFASPGCRLRFIYDRGILELHIGPRVAHATRRGREKSIETEWYDLSTLIDFLTQRPIRAPFLERSPRNWRSLSLDEHLEHISDRLKPHCDTILQFMKQDVFEQRRAEFADFLEKREQEVLRQIREAYPGQLGERNSSPIEHLFHLQRAERKAFSSIVAAINQAMRGSYSMLQYPEDILNTVAQALRDDRTYPFLVEKLKDPHQRYLAVIMLGWLGSKAERVLPELVELASWPSEVTGEACRAVIRIGNAETEVLCALLRSARAHEDMEFRHLWGLAYDAGYTSLEGFHDAIRVAAQSPNSDLREAAAHAAGDLNPADREKLVVTLEQLMQDEREFVRDAAEEALQGARNT